ncbi:unnamed protein product [marine sediment metagenome]|uniref:Uncharacterized protein n=1 Tax=marine sediment metagenome TaxID=412755 RepID=X0YB61_9ZZZZ
MKLQAIIGAGKGLTFNEHPTIREDVIRKVDNSYFTPSKTVDKRFESRLGKNIYIELDTNDLQGFYQFLSKNKYVLIDSKITQEDNITQDKQKLNEDYAQTKLKLKLNPANIA